MPWLSTDDLPRCHFEIGSGTCLQPLLRFSDRCREFVFVDLEENPQLSVARLRRAVHRLAVDAERIGALPPLSLDEVEVAASLSLSDFALAGSPPTLRALAAEALGPQQRMVDELLHAVGATTQRQWGVRCAFTRQIEHVDGSLEKRSLTMRLVGGEGILTYVALGGLDAPPLSVGTVQTGPGESHNGPLAHLFRFQAERGRPVPKVWVRGQRTPTHQRWDRQQPLAPAQPFARVGQVYTGWASDRQFDGARDWRRTVAGWVVGDEAQGAPSIRPALRLGPHRIVAAPLDRATVERATAVCLPQHLSTTLGVTALPSVYVVGRPARDILLPVARGMRAWAQTERFRSATQAVLVCQGYDDELGAVTRFLSSLEHPAVDVHLPMPLDFDAGARALNPDPIGTTCP
jgi:hypothetical protein